MISSISRTRNHPRSLTDNLQTNKLLMKRAIYLLVASSALAAQPPVILYHNTNNVDGRAAYKASSPPVGKQLNLKTLDQAVSAGCT